MNLVRSTAVACAALTLAGGVIIATPAAAAPPAPDLQTVDLTGTARFAAGRSVRPFSLIGATWTDPRARLGGRIEVRTRSDGRWTGWRALDADEPNTADPGTDDGPLRGSTDPLWVGASDGVEARTSGGAALPAGLRLDLINPDVPVAAPAAAGRAATVRPRPIPRMITRPGWGADENLVEDAPEYTDDLQVMFVHHTAGTNDYSCGQSASIIRGIQRYHVRSRGWNDIGYNFLVDKCGRLFEGRGGGVDRPVLGAHTLGFNAHSAAIAVLGDYGATAVSPAVRTVIAQVTDYKLGHYGRSAAGTSVLTSSGSDRYPTGRQVRLNRISGHRDTGRTDCPGDTLYGQLPSIRTAAASAPAQFRLARIGGAQRVGTRFYTRGLIAPYWSTATASNLIWRYDILVDGKFQTSAPGAHTAKTLRVPPGWHTVTVRAFHLSGRSVSITVDVYADSTAPRFTAGPTVALGTGSLDRSIPVRLGWKATDLGGLASMRLTRPAPVDLGVTATRYSARVARGVATTFALRARDRTGNATDAAVTRTATILSETGGTRTGSWATLRDPAYLGGSALRSTTRDSSVSWTFTGRAAALGVTRTTSSGRIKVYVDGAYTGVLDLRAALTQHRRAIWSRYFGDDRQHTVKVVTEGSTGRPGVILDGLAILH